MVVAMDAPAVPTQTPPLVLVSHFTWSASTSKQSVILRPLPPPPRSLTFVISNGPQLVRTTMLLAALGAEAQTSMSRRNPPTLKVALLHVSMSIALAAKDLMMLTLMPAPWIEMPGPNVRPEV